MNYHRIQIDDPIAGLVIVYRGMILNSPAVSASKYGVARYGCLNVHTVVCRDWVVWRPNRLDAIGAHLRIPLMLLAIEQCRRMASGERALERHEEAEWLSAIKRAA